MVRCISCVKPMRTEVYPYWLFFWRDRAVDYYILDPTQEDRLLLTYICQTCFKYTNTDAGKQVTNLIIAGRILKAQRQLDNDIVDDTGENS